MDPYTFSVIGIAARTVEHPSDSLNQILQELIHNKHSMTLQDLFSRLDKETQLYLKDLLNKIVSPDQLIDIIAMYKSLANDGHFDITQPLGRFIRMGIQTFETFLFDQMIHLFHSIVNYRTRGMSDAISIEQCFEYMEGNAESLVQIGLKLYRSPTMEEFLPYQVHNLVDHLVHLLETSSGTLPPEKVRQNIRQLLSDMPHLAKTHYLSYLNCLRSGDYDGARDSLHRFFDYRLINEGKLMYPYALLNLAALHAHFKHFSEVKAVIQEVIQVARENKEHECLSFALSWMQYEQDDQHVLQNAIESTKNLKQDYLHVLFLFSIARNGIQKGANPALVWKHLYHGLGIIEDKKVEGLKGAFYLLAGNAYERYGNLKLALEHYQEQAVKYLEQTPSSDAAMGFCYLAEAKFKSGCSESNVIQIYAQAEKLFPLFTHVSAPNWYRSKCLYQLKLALEKETFDVAFDLLKDLEDISVQETAHQIESLYWKCKYLFAVGQSHDAMDKIENELSHSKDLALPEYFDWNVRYQLLLAIMLTKQDNGIRALSNLFSALSLSKKCHCPMLQYESIICLWETLLELNMASVVQQNFRDVSEQQLIDLGDVMLLGRYHMIHARIFRLEENQEKTIEALLNAKKAFEMTPSRYWNSLVDGCLDVMNG